ncbi:hypothetical protein HYFRA_00009823 [Hymenoscyphus fraxineus]|uniref:Uncharacterized protein n=1 Tax=Hymenoscyphus fraxineus TaxID=746836 RepID=A0A9N9PX54_9HELO|nr:hypothetical protein HYFRA_00009823 [Hymenoscyphus fraxineus]
MPPLTAAMLEIRQEHQAVRCTRYHLTKARFRDTTAYKGECCWDLFPYISGRLPFTTSMVLERSILTLGNVKSVDMFSLAPFEGASRWFLLSSVS